MTLPDTVVSGDTISVKVVVVNGCAKKFPKADETQKSLRDAFVL